MMLVMMATVRPQKNTKKERPERCMCIEDLPGILQKYCDSQSEKTNECTGTVSNDFSCNVKLLKTVPDESLAKRLQSPEENVAEAAVVSFAGQSKLSRTGGQNLNR